MALQTHDTGLRYGFITRLLHWTMAALFAWQFTGMGLRLALGRTPIVSFFVGTHASVGTLLFTLAAVRAIWGFYNLRNRPAYERGLLGTAARLGHLALYTLMLVIPSLAILRAYGSGRGLSVFGTPLLPATSARVEWMMVPGQMLHGLLAWTLLAMIVGHIAMVMIHKHAWKDDVLSRMAGTPLPAAK